MGRITGCAHGRLAPHAKVAELVDARDLGSRSQHGSGGSSPPFRTIQWPIRNMPEWAVFIISGRYELFSAFATLVGIQPVSGLLSGQSDAKRCTAASTELLRLPVYLFRSILSTLRAQLEPHCSRALARGALCISSVACPALSNYGMRSLPPCSHMRSPAG